MAVIGKVGAEILIPVAAVIGIAFAVFQWYVVAKVPVPFHAGDVGKAGKGSFDEEEEEDGVDYRRVESRCAEIQRAISIGANSLLFTEYRYLAVFTAAFTAVIFLFLGSVRRFSAAPEPCAYDPARLCRPALANAARRAAGWAPPSSSRSGRGPPWGSSSRPARCSCSTSPSTSSTATTGEGSTSPSQDTGLGGPPWRCSAASVAASTPRRRRPRGQGGAQHPRGRSPEPSDFCWQKTIVPEYFTSNAYGPVQAVANSCRTGAATNVIFGLAVGYKSVIVPIFSIAAAIYASFRLAAMYGIALAALGMLSTIATGLSIDAYGPISDNAGGIAEMAGMPPQVRERTDALDAAGNTTAAIGKGFAIGSAALVSLALFGAYVSRAGIAAVDVLSPRVFAGLLVGAMLPYWFSAMTMRSVGSAALRMVEEVRRQFNVMEGLALPDYATCVKISTDASLRKMVAPGALVMLSPLIAGTLFGVETLAGFLAGALVSGVQVAISASNSGGAWDNAKKYIEAGASEEARALGPKGSDAHKAAVIGALKDTSGPSLNILIKLMAVEALVFAPFFAAHGGIIFNHL